jgi:hypothetical protein
LWHLAYQIMDGKRLTDHPMRYLCVGKAGGTVTIKDVLAVLGEDTEIDFSGVNRPEGSRESE